MRIVLSLGSNMGDRVTLLAQAVEQISKIPGTAIASQSSSYLSQPWGKTDQDCFINQVVIVETCLDPLSLLRQTQQIETELGRVRHERWGPRTVDIDVIAAGSLQHQDKELTLPHPYAQERAFVLVPWAELEPEAELFGYGPIADLAAKLIRQTPHALKRLTDVDLDQLVGAERLSGKGDH